MDDVIHSFIPHRFRAKSTELAIMKNKDAGGSQQTANLCEEDDGQQEAKRDPSSTSNVIVRPMTCGEVCTSIWHILTSDEAVVQTEVGPDGKETKMGLLGRHNARRRKLTLMHPIMVGLVFSAAGLYDAGTDVLLAATFGKTLLAEFNPSNNKCTQNFDPAWSEYSCNDRDADSWGCITRQCETKFLYLSYYTNFDWSPTPTPTMNPTPATSSIPTWSPHHGTTPSPTTAARRAACSASSDRYCFYNEAGGDCLYGVNSKDYAENPSKAAEHLFTGDHGIVPRKVRDYGVDVDGAQRSSFTKWMKSMSNCLDSDVPNGIYIRPYSQLAQWVVYLVMAKEALRLLVWIYFFTVGGINARKTSLFKYILYSPGTILFHRLPAVQQMIVETTQAVEYGKEAPWLKVPTTCFFTVTHTVCSTPEIKRITT